MALLSPSLIYLMPTLPAHALALQMARRAVLGASSSTTRYGKSRAGGETWGTSAARDDEAAGLTHELLTPAHDGFARVGASVRMMDSGCFMHEHVALSKLGGKPEWLERPAVLLPGAGRWWHTHKHK